jgi:hypothetical protein
MAKNLSAIFKLQGTIEDVTFVNSKAYGLHARARKYSKTPFVMTPPLAKGKDRLQLCNQYAQPVYDALRPEAHDGGAWSRLLKLLRAELKAGRPPGLECLKGFECNLQHPLAEVLPGGYDFSATKTQNQLRLHVLLHRHPKVEDSMPRTGYQLRVVAIFRDAEHGAVHKAVVLGPLTQYHAALEPVELTVPLPVAEGPCMLLMGIVPHLQGEGAARIMSDSGMKVVWASDRSAMEVAETNGNVRATITQLAMTHTENTQKAQAVFLLDQSLEASAQNLQQLRGIAFDWTRYDPTPTHVYTNQAFTRKLEDLGIEHEAEEYRGNSLE